MVTKVVGGRTVGPWSVWSVWLLAGWLGVPASSFELRPRYNCSLDYFDLEKEDSFMLGHQRHQYTWFGPHVGMLRACHGVARWIRQRLWQSSWRCACWLSGCAQELGARLCGGWGVLGVVGNIPFPSLSNLLALVAFWTFYLWPFPLRLSHVSKPFKGSLLPTFL